MKKTRKYRNEQIEEPTSSISNNVNINPKTKENKMAAKMTMKQINKLKELGMLKEDDVQTLIENGEVSAGRQPKGTAMGIKNSDGIYAFPQLYFKGNSAGVKAETEEMKKFRSEFQALVEEYCDEVELSEIETNKVVSENDEAEVEEAHVATAVADDAEDLID